MRTPPGVSDADFAEALKQFAGAVGAQWVFTSDEDVATYKDAYSPLWGEPDEKVASAAVAPDSVEQVQKVVAIANRFSIPLYTVSTGRNLAYGGSAPVHSGSVVLDLKRMNRVLEVSEEHACALVEPGVSYFDLYRHIREKSLKLWIDVPDPGWGSLIGNALDHGAGRTALPYRDHFDAHCGMEVVLASGQVVRTGMGAIPGSKLWQQTKYGPGPLLDGIFSQSNFGIVTKMGFWLMPEPEASMSGRIRVPRHDDVIPFVRTLASLMYSNVVNCNFTVLSPVFLSPPNPEKQALVAKADGGTAQEWDRYAASNGPGHFWETTLRFYGPPKIMAAQWEHVKERLASIEGVRFDDGETTRFPLTDEQISKLADVTAFGIPSLSAFSGLAMGAVAGAPGGVQTTGHLDASPIVPISGEALLKAQRVFNRIFLEAGLPQSLGFAFNYHWRTFIVFQGMQVSTNQEHNAKIRAAYEKCAQAAADNGWGLYRAHAAFHDKVMSLSSFNDHALMRLNEVLKDALDPKGILSAGRYGIWPRHLRRSRV
jgi:4-cresol dehydrogenase (hydroxylating)